MKKKVAMKGCSGEVKKFPVCRIEKIGIDRAESEGCFLSEGQEDGDEKA